MIMIINTNLFLTILVCLVAGDVVPPDKSINATIIKGGPASLLPGKPHFDSIATG